MSDINLLTTVMFILVAAAILFLAIYIPLASRMDRIERNQRKQKREIERLHDNERRDKKLPRPNATPDYWD